MAGSKALPFEYGLVEMRVIAFDRASFFGGERVARYRTLPAY